MSLEATVVSLKLAGHTAGDPRQNHRFHSPSQETIVIDRAALRTPADGLVVERSCDDYLIQDAQPPGYILSLDPPIGIIDGWLVTCEDGLPLFVEIAW